MKHKLQQLAGQMMADQGPGELTNRRMMMKTSADSSSVSRVLGAMGATFTNAAHEINQ